MEKKKEVSLQKNFIFNLIYQILTLILPLITTPYISRTLQAENIGIYSYTFAILSTFMMVGSLGIATYGQKEIAANREDSQVRNLLFWEILLVRGITICVALVAYVYYAFVDSKYTIYYLVQLPYLISAVIDISWFFQGIERFDIIVYRNLLIKIVGIVLIFTLIKDQGDLVVYLLILSFSQLLGNLTAWMYVPRLLSKPALRKSKLIWHFKQTLVYFIPTIAYQVYAVLDRVMLGAIIGSEAQNGYYEQAHKIINMIVSVYSAYNIVLRSRMSYYFSKHEDKKIRIQFNQSVQMVIFLSLAMSFGLFGIAKGFVPWFFGEGYDEVVNLLYLFCPMIFVMGFSMCIGTHILTPGEMQKKANIAQCVAAVVNLIFNAALIPVFQARGAAIASFLSQLSVLIIYLILVKFFFDIKVFVVSFAKSLVSAVGMFSLIMLSNNYLRMSVTSTFLQIVIGAIVYVTILVILRDQFVTGIISSFLHKIKAKVKKNG